MHVTRLCKFGVSQGSGMIGGATTLDVTLMYVVVRRTPCRQITSASPRHGVLRGLGGKCVRGSLRHWGRLGVLCASTLAHRVAKLKPLISSERRVHLCHSLYIRRSLSVGFFIYLPTIYSAPKNWHARVSTLRGQESSSLTC